MKKTNKTESAATPFVVPLNDVEKGIVSDLIRREKLLMEEAARLRVNTANLITVIAARAGIPADAKLNLDTDRWSISIREV